MVLIRANKTRSEEASSESPSTGNRRNFHPWLPSLDPSCLPRDTGCSSSQSPGRCEGLLQRLVAGQAWPGVAGIGGKVTSGHRDHHPEAGISPASPVGSSLPATFAVGCAVLTMPLLVFLQTSKLPCFSFSEQNPSSYTQTPHHTSQTCSHRGRQQHSCKTKVAPYSFFPTVPGEWK